MAYKARAFTCSSCGQAIIRRAASGATVRCVPCGIAHQAEVARQLHAHEGPLYEEWRQAWLAAAARFADPLEGQAEAEAGVAEGLRPRGRGTPPLPCSADLQFLLKPRV